MLPTLSTRAIVPNPTGSDTRTEVRQPAAAFRLEQPGQSAGPVRSDPRRPVPNPIPHRLGPRGANTSHGGRGIDFRHGSDINTDRGPARPPCGNMRKKSPLRMAHPPAGHEPARLP